MNRFQMQELWQHMGWIVPLLALFLVVVGCTGNSSSNTPSIAFVSTAALDGSNAPNAAANIWFAKADGSAAIPLTRLTAELLGTGELSWSPDGTRLAFNSMRALDGSDAINGPYGAPNVWLINADGSGATPLTHFQHVTAWRPIWSPDGTKLAFASNGALDGSDAPNEVDNVWVVNADGSNAIPITKLTDFNAGTFGYTWSPDSKKLAFLSTGALDGSDASNPATNIWTSNVDGSGLTPLTTLTASRVVAFNLTWAPRTNQLAFASNRALDGSNAPSPGGALNVWVINADGSGLTSLTRLTTPVAYSPVWSPDGSKLAYASDRALDGSDTQNGRAAENIWVMNADGSGTFPLTKLTAVRIVPQSWSPDASRIAYTSQQALDGSDALNPSGSFNVWLVNTDGSGAIPLTKISSQGASSQGPAWRP